MLNENAHIAYVVHSMESGRNLKLRSAGPMARLPYSACWEPEQAASVVVWDGTGNLLTSFVFYKGMFHSKVAMKLKGPCLLPVRQCLFLRAPNEERAYADACSYIKKKRFPHVCLSGASSRRSFNFSEMHWVSSLSFPFRKIVMYVYSTHKLIVSLILTCNLILSKSSLKTFFYRKSNLWIIKQVTGSYLFSCHVTFFNLYQQFVICCVFSSCEALCNLV